MTPDESRRSSATNTEPAAPRPEPVARLDRVFGDVLPSTTSDEPRHEPASDEWYLANRPPHHR